MDQHLDHFFVDANVRVGLEVGSIMVQEAPRNSAFLRRGGAQGTGAGCEPESRAARRGSHD